MSKATPFDEAISKFLTPLGFIPMSITADDGTDLCTFGNERWMIEVVNDVVVIYPDGENPKWEIIHIDLNDPQSLDKILHTING